MEGTDSSRREPNREDLPQSGRPGKKHDRAAGFTIVEIMVVVVIIGMLATVVVQSLFGEVDTAKLNKVKRDLSGLSEAAERYNLRIQSWPESIEDMVNPESGSSFIKEAPLDPWNQEYQIDGINEKGDSLFIRCAGNDKEFDTEDDITTENYKRLTELPKIDKGN